MRTDTDSGAGSEVAAPEDPDRAPTEGGAASWVPPARRVVRRRRLLGTWRRQLVAGLIIGGAIGYVVYQGLGNATEFFLTANQAVAERASLGARPFRIEGTVENDVRQVAGTTRFDIYAGGATVAVVTTSEPSALFKPGIPVVLEGHWAGDHFACDLIMVKHSASYTEAHPDRLKSQLPSKSSSGSSGT